MDTHSLFIAWIYWNPERVAFTVPLIDRPVVFYGLWFVFGFIVGYYIMLSMFKQRLSYLPKEEARRQAFSLSDQLTWFIVAGTLIGARLGHVFFYEWSLYSQHPAEIIKIWKGGLASHGAAIGILIALFFYQRLISRKYPDFSFLSLLDMLVVAAAFGTCCIRIGNFFNQEIVGLPSTLPWAIIFGDPLEGGPIVPRHPVQLYEATAYLAIFFLLYYLWWKKRDTLGVGTLSGLFFILASGARFVLEFFKESQGNFTNSTWLQTGHYLTIPFILGGLILFVYSYRSSPHAQRILSKPD